MQKTSLLLCVVVLLAGMSSAQDRSGELVQDFGEFTLEFPHAGWMKLERGMGFTDNPTSKVGDKCIITKERFTESHVYAQNPDPNGPNLDYVTRKKIDPMALGLVQDRLWGLPGFRGSDPEAFRRNDDAVIGLKEKYRYGYNAPMQGIAYFLQADDVFLYMFSCSGTAQKLPTVEGEIEDIIASIKFKDGRVIRSVRR